MKSRITIAAIALLLAGHAIAGSPQEPQHGRGGPNIDRMAILLDLDEGQKAAVQQVFDEQRAQRKAEWESRRQDASATRPSREEMQAKREQMQKETTEKLRPILSDVQMTKLEALMADRPHKRRRDNQPQ